MCWSHTFIQIGLLSTRHLQKSGLITKARWMPFINCINSQHCNCFFLTCFCPFHYDILMAFSIYFEYHISKLCFRISYTQWDSKTKNIWTVSSPVKYISRWEALVCSGILRFSGFTWCSDFSSQHHNVTVLFGCD